MNQDEDIVMMTTQMLKWWAEQREAGQKVTKDDLNDYFFDTWPQASLQDALMVAQLAQKKLRPQ